MEKKNTFFFFVFGQSAKYFLMEMSRSKKKFNFFATNTKKSKNVYFNKKKYKSFKFNGKSFDKRLIKPLENSNYILVSVPPQGNNDVVLNKFSKILKNLNFKKLIYLSATSVYGNYNGKWVNENSKLKGKTKFGIRRIMAKKVEKFQR